LLSGCTGAPAFHPGDAAVVEGQHISLDTVDGLARDLCSLDVDSLNRAGQAYPMSGLRAIVLQSLVDDVLVQKFARDLGLDVVRLRKTADQVVDQMEFGENGRLRAVAMAWKRRAVFRDLVLYGAGLVRLGNGAPEDAARLQGATAFRLWRAEAAPVDRDPRFIEVDLDAESLKPGSGSLSVDLTRLVPVPPAEDDEPGRQKYAAYLAKLPADQRCGTPTATTGVS